MTTTAATAGTPPTRHRSTEPAASPVQAIGAPAAASGPTWNSVRITVLFVVGCALLVGCALAIDHLGDWSAEYGRIWVFLGFFLAMSLGGRWFWAGADTAIAWIRTLITH